MEEKILIHMTAEEVIQHIEELRNKRLFAAEERVLEKARKQSGVKLNQDGTPVVKKPRVTMKSFAAMFAEDDPEDNEGGEQNASKEE